MGFVGNKQKDKFSEKEGGHEYPEHPPPPLGTTLFKARPLLTIILKLIDARWDFMKACIVSYWRLRLLHPKY